MVTVLLRKRVVMWLNLGFDTYVKISRITSKRTETAHRIKKEMEWEKHSIQTNTRKKEKNNIKKVGQIGNP